MLYLNPSACFKWHSVSKHRGGTTSFSERLHSSFRSWVSPHLNFHESWAAAVKCFCLLTTWSDTEQRWNTLKLNKTNDCLNCVVWVTSCLNLQIAVMLMETSFLMLTFRKQKKILILSNYSPCIYWVDQKKPHSDLLYIWSDQGEVPYFSFILTVPKCHFVGTACWWLIQISTV